MNHRNIIHAGLLGLGFSLAFSAPGILAQNAGAPGDDNQPRRIRPRQPGGPGGPGGPGRSPIEALNLTPEQRPRVEAELRDFQEKMRALREEHDRRITALLTPEQAEQYRNMQRRPGGPGFGGPGGPGGNRGGGFGRNPEQMLQRMKTELNLTAAQETRINQILQDNRAQQEALRASMQQPNADRNALRTQMQALRRSQNEQIQAVLTPEQRQRWETLQPRRGPGQGGPGGGRRGGGGGNPANSL